METTSNERLDHTQAAPVETAPAAQTEEEKRKAHEASEAKRKAEWEAKKKAREEAETLEWEKAVAVDEDTLIANSVKRLADDTERLTRRNMKLCVTEFVQTKCYEDPAFARQVMHPRKSMLNCFHYINRKAREYLEQEMKDNDEKPERGMYGGDVPDDLCYEWAVEYFTLMDLPEDKGEEDEKFVPKPYHGITSSKAKKTVQKKAAKEQKPEPQPAEEDNLTQMQFSLENLIQQNKPNGEVSVA